MKKNQIKLPGHGVPHVLKSSQKRLTIMEYFLKKDRHVTIEQLYNEVKKTNPKISYSTVYRTLRLLADRGFAQLSHFGDTKTRFEPTHQDEHHDHLVCIKCGRIREFKHEVIEKLQHTVAKKYGFLIRDHKLELYGLCSHCSGKRRS